MKSIADACIAECERHRTAAQVNEIAAQLGMSAVMNVL